MDHFKNPELAQLLDPEGAAADALIQKVEKKDDFHTKRMRCITNPDRALETLGPHARLEVVVQCARNLQPRESWTGHITMDPLVGVFLDDFKLEDPNMRTLVVRGTTNPLWQHRMYVDIVSPSSMVRFQVYDDQITHKVEAGFVELCVADMAYNTPISGWFELRFQENLKNNSVKRYASHCAVREDEVVLAHQEISEATASSSARVARTTSNISNAVPVSDLKARSMVHDRALQKTKTFIHSFTHACAGGAQSASRESDRGNAGELFLQIRLVKVVSNVDSLFALALDMPAPKSMGDYVLVEEGQQVRKSLDLQKVMDTWQLVRIRLWEDFICCIYYWIRYIATWQQPILSLPIFIFSCTVCIHAYYATIIVPGLIGCLLWLNGWEGLRFQMTRGGLNAAFTPEGFRQVARWRKTGEMEQYLKRIVQYDLNGSVHDQPQLRLLAKDVFRDGKPVCELAEVRAMLKRKSDMIQYDSDADSHFKEGDIVMVDQRRNATVVGTDSNGQVRVTFDVDGHAQGEHTADFQDEPASDKKDKTDSQTKSPFAPKGTAVDPTRLRHRQTVPFYQTWLLPTAIRNAIADSMEQFDKLEHSALYPAIHTATQVVTWQGKRCASRLIVIVMMLLCVVGCRLEYVYWQALEHERGRHIDIEQFEESYAWFAISAIRNVDNIIMFSILFAVFILNAKWFNCVKSVLKVIGRMSAPRKAPECWKFYRDDEQMQKALKDLAPKTGDWPDFTQLAKIPDSLKGPMATLPDLQNLQAQLGKIQGLANFKLPDLTHPSNQAAPSTDRPV